MLLVLALRLRSYSTHTHAHDVGALLIIRIGFSGPLYYTYKKEPKIVLVSNNLSPYISPRLLNHKPQEPTWLGTEILKLGETPTNMRRMNPNPKT